MDIYGFDSPTVRNTRFEMCNNATKHFIKKKIAKMKKF